MVSSRLNSTETPSSAPQDGYKAVQVPRARPNQSPLPPHWTCLHLPAQTVARAASRELLHWGQVEKQAERGHVMKEQASQWLRNQGEQTPDLGGF